MNTFDSIKYNNSFSKLTEDEKLAVAWWIDCGLCKSEKSYELLLDDAVIFYSRNHKHHHDMTNGLLEHFKSDKISYREYKTKILLD